MLSLVQQWIDVKFYCSVQWQNQTHVQWDNTPCSHSQFPHSCYYRKDAKPEPAFSNLFHPMTLCWHHIPYRAMMSTAAHPQTSAWPQWLEFLGHIGSGVYIWWSGHVFSPARVPCHCSVSSWDPIFHLCACGGSSASLGVQCNVPGW